MPDSDLGRNSARVGKQTMGCERGVLALVSATRNACPIQFRVSGALLVVAESRALALGGSIETLLALGMPRGGLRKDGLRCQCGSWYALRKVALAAF